MKCFVKICGITHPDDASIAAGLGADFVGIIVEIDGSPRSVCVEEAAHIISCAAVPAIILLEKKPAAVCKLAMKLGPYAVQLIGNYSYQDVQWLRNTLTCGIWKTIQIPRGGCSSSEINDLADAVAEFQRAGVDAVVLDTKIKGKKGGTGQTCDWESARVLVERSPLPVFLAGGITPENAADARARVMPYGIDVSSGVEHRPGKKDQEKITRLMSAVARCIDDHVC